jgi:hypothetical protein
MTHRKTRFPTTTVHQSRLQLFQPTRRPREISREIKTAWGTAKIIGKIGQVHADMLEAMCKYALDSKTSDTGQILLLVDPYKVRTCMGGGKEYSYDTIWRMITELKRVVIELNAPSQSLRILGGILDRVDESTYEATSHNGRSRKMWVVTLNSAFSDMLSVDLPLNYDPAPLAKLETGVGQAIARHVLTHQNQPNGGWMLDELIKAVGAGSTSAEMRKKRFDVNADSENLEKMGILVANGRVKLTR